jgi:perosamine synthetase
VAHLFGGQVEMAPILEVAHRHGLLVIEDCAQAFAGAQYQGHAGADVSMFSFGTIKNSTALGGAILRVSDRELLERMRATQAAYPVQSRWVYFRRLAKYSTFKALTRGPIWAALLRLCRAIGCDYDHWLNQASRGFPGDDSFAQIRRQPSGPLLAVLKRRLQRYDRRRAERHAAKGRAMSALLHEFCCPGTAAEPHTYWVFPVLAEQPMEIIDRLTRAGFDATQGHSLCAVPPPPYQSDGRPHRSENVLAQIVFLPFYPELPLEESERMAEVLSSFLHKPPSATS